MAKLDNSINRYCELVVLINELNDKLSRASSRFYDGGTPFNECYSCEIEELVGYQSELKNLLKLIVKEKINELICLI